MFKNRFSLLCLAVASSLTLTACDVVDAAYDETLNDNAPPEIVIAGGFKIDIQGNAVPVEGYDNCSLNTLQGSFDTDKSNCIVLDRTRKKNTGSSSFVIRSRQRRMEDRAPKLKKPNPAKISSKLV